ncbi:hypothetical protein B005_4487 [Nocardiopsis alba ATCC BAA-2165]|uniref:Uncharacterized protein n=1 Tax=Nocardiopsis alba (strain ATCC BAA-2165 / BE74) TaxID=1205910 RepID=J7L342_NOCAA|nr:hypothetical protein B005_4487 [Nocardiopsis alba ATCC BAA-2165]
MRAGRPVARGRRGAPARSVPGRLRSVVAPCQTLSRTQRRRDGKRTR